MVNTVQQWGDHGEHCSAVGYDDEHCPTVGNDDEKRPAV